MSFQWISILVLIALHPLAIPFWNDVGILDPAQGLDLRPYARIYVIIVMIVFPYVVSTTPPPRRGMITLGLVLLTVALLCALSPRLTT